MFHIIREMDEMQTVQIARRLDRSYKAVSDFVHEGQDARERCIDFDLTEVCDVDDVPVPTCDVT